MPTDIVSLAFSTTQPCYMMPMPRIEWLSGLLSRRHGDSMIFIFVTLECGVYKQQLAEQMKSWETLFQSGV